MAINASVNELRKLLIFVVFRNLIHCNVYLVYYLVSIFSSVYKKTISCTMEQSSRLNFIVASMVSMSNGIYNHVICYSIFRISLRILGQSTKISTEETFSTDLNNVTSRHSGTKVMDYTDYLLLNMKQIKDLWDSYVPEHEKYTSLGIDIVKKKIQSDQNMSSWPITDAFFIWQWLHVIAIDMDINAGYIEKRAFLNFIPNIITCSSCRLHYLQNKKGLLKALQDTSCSNAMLALHTHINASITNYSNNDNPTNFVYKKTLANKLFWQKYINDYLLLMKA